MSHRQLLVSSACGGTCSECRQTPWQLLDAAKLYDLLDGGTFFSVFPRSSVFHIYGQNPVAFKGLVKLVMFLYEEGIKVSIWSDTLLSFDYLNALAPYIVRWYCLLPSVVEEAYQRVVFDQSFDDFCNNVKEAVQEKLPITLHVPVTQERLPELTDMSDFAKGCGVPILFHYAKTSLTKEQRDFVFYCEGYPHVRVWPYKAAKMLQCCEVPQFGQRFDWVYWRSEYRSFLRRCRRYFRL